MGLFIKKIYNKLPNLYKKKNNIYIYEFCHRRKFKDSTY